MPLYTLTFHEDGTDRRDRDREAEIRLSAVADVMMVVGAAEERPVIVLAAGFVQARSHEVRDRWATELNELSREHRVALAFGMDVTGDSAEYTWEPEARPRSFAFACDRGRALLWAAPVGQGRIDGTRLLELGGLRALILADGEVFQPAAREQASKSLPDLIVTLAHGRPTKKWLPALAKLDQHAPLLVAHKGLAQRNPVWAAAVRGWLTSVVTSDDALTIHRYLPLPSVAQAVGTWETEGP